MAYLSQYSPVLTAETAAHLLRRATAGPTKTEIANFTGKTALQDIQTCSIMSIIIHRHPLFLMKVPVIIDNLS